ncbi:MAG: DNA starvation/stationary phase protection protein [Tenericutes bacterium HGW-Tenericutes-1]|nr:MAG: DNA starvation/stationary phase protection protein [Tenericutes bacterium HGW-Tenericutes-1]
MNNMNKLIDLLNREVANFAVLYTKLHQFHWNVKGVRFYQFHALFEKLYDEVTENMDVVAERILMLEGQPLSTLSDFLKFTTIKEGLGNESDMQMINQIIYDFTTIDEELKEAIKVAQNLIDEVTVDILIGIDSALQKHLWMLKSLEK